MAFLLLVLPISALVGLVTEKLGVAAIVLSTYPILVGLAKYQEERRSLKP